MDIERFGKSPIGRLTPIRVEQHETVVEHFAYVPDPLPDQIELRPATYAVIESAAIELGALEGAAAQLESSYLITRPSIRREAISTSALEGTYATLEDLFGVDFDDDHVPDNEALAEVANYVVAAELGVAALSERPVSHNLVCELHETLMRGSTYQGSAGALRTGQVAIGRPGALVSEARFVPPPPGPGLAELFSDWEKWNYRQDTLPLIARVAASHYQFETIHPFFDGNGRIGRLLAILLLIDRGPLTDHYLVLSPYLETRRERYFELLAETTVTGNFDSWVRFFAEAVRAEASAARGRIAALAEYRRSVVEMLRATGVRGLIIGLAESLIEQPVITPASVARRFEASYQTANRVIERLVAEGVLRETTGRRYGRSFVAPEVLRILRLGR